MSSTVQLVFVYNADGGLFNSVTDAAHKILKPSTYECNLCILTHGAATMKRRWRTFLAGADVDAEFLHRDEFIERYPQLAETNLPAVFQLHREDIALSITAVQLNALQNLSELITLVQDSISKK